MKSSIAGKLQIQILNEGIAVCSGYIPKVEEIKLMLAKVVGLALLLAGGLLALQVAGFLFSLIWKIGLAISSLVILIAGWRLLKR